MSQDEGFLQAIIDNPDDDTPRLIYADWLEEQGQPRGEFIRLQVWRAALPAGDPARAEMEQRERQLLAEHEPEWLRPLRPWVREWQFHRGFVEWVRIPAEWAVGAGRIVFRRTPVRHARFNEATYLLGELAALPGLAGLRSLDLGHNALTAGQLEPLTRSLYLNRLEALDLGVNTLGDAGIEVLTRAVFPRLRWLSLFRNQLTAEGLRILLEAQGWPAPTHLNLAANALAGEGVQVLAQSPRVQEVEELNLSGSVCQDEGALALAGSPYLGNLRHLNLAYCRIGDAGAEALARSPVLANLQTLDLTYNELTDAGAVTLARSPTLAGLRSLVLDFNSGISSPRTRKTLRKRFGNQVSVR